MSKNQWVFPGRYGDEEQTVTIKTMPDKLSERLKQALRQLYENDAEDFYECDIEFGGFELSKLGLGCQIGNAWHHKIMWAPQVHKWMKKKDTNDDVGRSLCQQYA